MRSLRVRAARTLGAGALLGGLAVLASALACSFIISGSFPVVYCVPGGDAAVCAPGLICAPNYTGSEHTCTRPCSKTNPCSQGVCDEVQGFCLTPMNTMDGMVTTDDSGPMDAGQLETPAEAAEVSPPETGPSDVEAGPCNGFGCPCTRIAECGAKFVCVNKPVLSDIDAGTTGGFCAKPCCTSGDCDPGANGTVCFATGAGGNYCVPPRLLGDRSSIGGGGGGTACMSGSDCRSGLCADSGTCADTCCSTRSSSACANPTACGFNLFPGGGFDVHWTANCSVPQPGFPSASGCALNSDCQSNLCVPTGQPFPSGYCVDPCRRAGDCTFGAECQYYQDPTLMSDIVAACIPARGRDAGLAVCFVDDPSSSNGDCQPNEYCRPQPNVMVGAGTFSVLACGM